MHPSQLLVIGALLANTAVSKPMFSNIWSKRQTTTTSPQPSWINDSTGNITIVLSDNKISFGDANPSDVLGQLYTQCYDAGTCNPDTFTSTAATPASPGGINDMTISLNVQTAFYPTWVKNGLIESLQAAATSAMTSSNVTYSPNTICTSGPDCVWQPNQSIEQFTFPDGISIVYENPDPTQGPLGVIAVGITMTEDQGSGFCSTFTTVGSAIAGAVNGAAGGIFTLLGLACQ